MNNMMNHIETIINGFITTYNSRIAEKYNLDVSELNSLWNEVKGCDNSITPISIPTLIPTPTPISKTKTVKQVEIKPVEGEKTCPYSFTRGPNSGSLCGSKVKGEGSHCSRHKQYEAKEQKKVLPPPKKVQEDTKSANGSSSEDEEKVREELKKKIYDGYSETEISRMFFRKPELSNGLLFHKQTNLVCDESKFIVGKKEGSNVVPLSEQDIKVAKSWNFKIKPNNKPLTETQPPIQTLPTQTQSQSQSQTQSQSRPVIQSIVESAITHQESKTETKKKPILVSAKKFNISVPVLNVKIIEKEKLQVNDEPVKPKTVLVSKSVSLNEEAKNTKKSITSLIEQQKQTKPSEDIEDMLDEITKGSDDDDNNSLLEEEDEIDIGDDGEYDEE
jgi:hypothetical protein